jgi:triacylglycerol lipase
MAARRVLRPCVVSLLASLGIAMAGFAAGGSALELGNPPDRVVLLHGLGRGASSLSLLALRLEARGFRVCNVDYSSRVDSIERAVAEVSEAIRQCGFAGSQLSYVTHSLGALVLRALLADSAAPPGGRAVLLAPPNGGSEIAERLRRLDVFDALLGPLASQLGTRAGDLPFRYPPPPIPFGVIAGDHWINPLGAVWLPAPHDGTVSVASTRLEGMTGHIVVPYTHSFMPYAESVADHVETFLRTGRFEIGAGSSGP